MANDTRPGAIRVPDTYMDIEVTEDSGEVARHGGVTWSVDKGDRSLYIYDRSGRRIVQYNPSGWVKVVVL